MKKLTALMMFAVLVTGCGQKPKPDINVLMAKANSSLATGATNIALVTLSEALKDGDYKQYRGQIFSQILEIMLAGNRTGEATSTFNSVLGTDEELTRAGFSTLGRYYQGPGGIDAFEAWTRNMLNASLPKDLLEQAYTWQINIAQTKNDLTRMIALIPEVIRKFSPEIARRILQNMISIQVTAQKYDQARTMIDAIEQKCGDDVILKQSLISQRVQLLLTQERWQEGEKLFKDSAAALADNQLKDCFLQAIAKCEQKDQLNLSDKLCEFIMDTQKNKTSAAQAAAYQFMETTGKRKDVAAIPVRLESIKAKGIASDVLSELLEVHFYTVINSGTKEQVAAMNDFAGKLLTDIKNNEIFGRIQTMILDGKFIQEDYAGIVTMIEAGIKDKPQIWLEMISNKAKAHKMLKEGNPKEAVKYFRKFMENLATRNKPERDPTSPMLYSPEMCLGFNARRIGDILAKTGETKDSEEAYEEARNFFKKAMINLSTNSLEMDFINKQLAAIPDRKN